MVSFLIQPLGAYELFSNMIDELNYNHAFTKKISPYQFKRENGGGNYNFQDKKKTRTHTVSKMPIVWFLFLPSFVKYAVG